MNPGPITIEEMFNIFPFNNAITKMELSGLEVQELFDYVAQYSQGRGCVSQAQIAGARVLLDCSGCARPGSSGTCVTDNDCVGGLPGSCQRGVCNVTACADQIYIGQRTCNQGRRLRPGESRGGYLPSRRLWRYGRLLRLRARRRLRPTREPGHLLRARRLVERSVLGSHRPREPLPARDKRLPRRRWLRVPGASPKYDAAGYLYPAARRSHRLHPPRSSVRIDLQPLYRRPQPSPVVHHRRRLLRDRRRLVRVLLPGRTHTLSSGGVSACQTDTGGCPAASGQCVLQACRDQVAAFHETVCDSSPNRPGCLVDLDGCSIAGEECKFLSCVDQQIGSTTDNRVEMVGR